MVDFPDILLTHFHELTQSKSISFYIPMQRRTQNPLKHLRSCLICENNWRLHLWWMTRYWIRLFNVYFYSSAFYFNCCGILEIIEMAKSTGFEISYTIFVSNTFVSNTRLKLAKNQTKSKQNPGAELLPFENYTLSPFMLSSKTNMRYSKKCAKTRVSVLKKLCD